MPKIAMGASLSRDNEKDQEENAFGGSDQPKAEGGRE